MKNIEIIHTADGSNTIYLPELDENYHSIKGAITESQHIFIACGLSQLRTLPQLTVLEIGFGTGLNTYLTAKYNQTTDQKISYVTLEKNPLSWNTVYQLNYTSDKLFETIHTADWNIKTDLTPQFSLLKLEADFTKKPKLPSTVDVVYFDAFAPEKQEEMWSKELFDYLYVSMNRGGVLTTYCSKGVIRRRLQEVGFEVERLPGPPNGKREILRATKK